MAPAPQRGPGDPAVSGWRLGTLRGVPVYLGSSWPIIAIVIVVLFGPPLQNSLPGLGAGAYAVAAGYAVLLLASVLVHEAAHALVGQWRGYRVSRIVADLWGGHTAYDHADTTPGSSALVAVVGPAANGVLALVGWAALPAVSGDVPQLLCAAFAWSNGFVALFNLIPALPLDGGYLLEALIWKVTGNRSKGTVTAGWAGRILAVGIVAWFVLRPILTGERPSLFSVVWVLFIAAFLWFGATGAIRGGQARQLLSGVRIRDVVVPATIVDGTTLIRDLPDGALAVASPGRAPWGLVDPHALAAVPGANRDLVPVSAAVSARPEGWTVAVNSLDEDVTPLVTAVQAHQLDDVLVVVTGQPVATAHLAETRRLAAALRR